MFNICDWINTVFEMCFTESLFLSSFPTFFLLAMGIFTFFFFIKPTFSSVTALLVKLQVRGLTRKTLKWKISELIGGKNEKLRRGVYLKNFSYICILFIEKHWMESKIIEYVIY